MSSYQLGYLMGYLLTPVVIGFLLVWAWTAIRKTKVTVGKVIVVSLVLFAFQMITVVKTLAASVR